MTKDDLLKRIANLEYAARFGFSSDEYAKLRIKFNTFVKHAKKRTAAIELTLQDYILLCYQANIKAEDIGLTNGKYQLGRIGDKGEYKLGNVRFITKEQNMQELYANGGFARGVAKRTKSFKSTGDYIEQQNYI